MLKKFRIPLIALALLLLALAGLAVWLYSGMHRVPEFYSRALAAEPATQRRDSDEMTRRAADLRNAARRNAPWQATFTAEQINGWLAVDLVRNFPQLLPPEFRDPRVAIATSDFTVGCYFTRGGIESVLSLSADVYLQAPDVIALRFHSARAGAVPLPLDQVIPKLTAVAEHLGFIATLSQTEGDPVLLLSLPPSDNSAVHIDGIELGDGQVTLTGHTRRGSDHTSPKR